MGELKISLCFEKDKLLLENRRKQKQLNCEANRMDT